MHHPIIVIDGNEHLPRIQRRSFSVAPWWAPEQRQFSLIFSPPWEAATRFARFFIFPAVSWLSLIFCGCFVCSDLGVGDTNFPSENSGTATLPKELWLNFGSESSLYGIFMLVCIRFQVYEFISQIGMRAKGMGRGEWTCACVCACASMCMHLRVDTP